jgi:hypothetical protein
MAIKLFKEYTNVNEDLGGEATNQDEINFLQKTKKHLIEFDVAYRNLKSTWAEDYMNDVDLNEFLSKDYPSDLPSFDEINIPEWVEFSIKDIDRKIEKLKE